MKLMTFAYTVVNFFVIIFLITEETFEPCSHPGTPKYGIPSSTKLHFQAGETLLYSCVSGHQLLGEPVLHCVPGHPSQWNGLPPVCKGEELQPFLVFSSVFTCKLNVQVALL